MQVAFRVDASVDMGSGHVMRCLTLADELEAIGKTVTFITRAHNGHLAGLIGEHGYNVTLLSKSDKLSSLDSDHNAAAKMLGVSWQQDAIDTQNALKETAPEWLIVDHYSLDACWHKKLRKQVGNIFVIDDLANRLLDCDLLLDQTYGRNNEVYRAYVNKECRILLGSHWALLRSEFAKLRSKAACRRSKFSGIQRILVSVGGADPDNVTGTVLEGLATIDWQAKMHIDIVLGSQSPHIQSVLSQAAKSPLKVTVTNDAKDMADRMLNADLAIGAGGTTSWERCCLGLPALITACADNQKEVCRLLEQAGAAVLMPNSDELTHSHIVESMQKIVDSPGLWQKMSRNALKIANGSGAKRVALELFPEVSVDGLPIRLRPAKYEDADILYLWQSDPKTRRFFHNTAVPAYDEHVDWLKQRVNNVDVFTEIIMHGEEPAGVVRLDPVKALGTSSYLVSIYVSPDKYRLGLAKGALKLLERIVPEKELRAEVNKGNIASHTLFKAVGFQCVSNTLYIKPAAFRVNCSDIK